MYPALVLAYASSILVAHGAPLCRDEGLWGTAWCLAVKTGSLGRDTVSYGLAIATMLQSRFFKLARVPQLHDKVANVWGRMKLWRVGISVQPTDFAQGLNESLGAGCRHRGACLTVTSAAERHRAAFVKKFPEHAALLPARDMTEIGAVSVWIVLAALLTRYVAHVIRSWWKRPQVMFFPDKSGKNVARICRHISRARHRVWLAMFTFTDDLLSEELMRAHERGVDVRVIVDDAQCEVQGAEAAWLANSGVPVTTDRSGARMHHKFVVSDYTVLSGSFNWTRQASMANNENLCILKDSHVVKSFAREFTSLWIKFNGRGGRLHCKRALRRCHTPPVHTHGGG